MAYARIASLLRTIELVMTGIKPIQSLICEHKEVIFALHRNVGSLESFLKNFKKHSNDPEAMTELEAKIKDVANAAEDKIEVGLTEIIMAKDEMQKGVARERLDESLQQVAEDIYRVQKESTKIQDIGREASKKLLVQEYSNSAKRHTLDIVHSTNMMGRENEMKKVLLELTRGSSDELKVIPIIGMGGIGKTTLAAQVFKDWSIQSHFDIRAWVTISKKYNVEEILISLLRSIKMAVDVNNKKEADLADLLQKSLKGKMYIIVMDDMWSNEAWDDITLCFPNNNTGSRIIITTREIEVASYASSENLSLHLDFMNSDESWNLFKSKAFPNERIPLELETIGKQIAYKCQGLPLTILVVARLLSKSEKKIEEWENISENIKSFVAEDPDKQCLRMLELSYNHLPDDLKAFLLYLGFFPEDTEISVKRLVRSWIAEGFLKFEIDLEGEAEKFLQQLIDRCLVIVSQKSSDGRKIKTCKVHDLVHEFCLIEAQKQNFLVMNDHILNMLYVISPLRWYFSRHKARHDFMGQTVYGIHDVHDLLLMNRARSILCFGSRHVRIFCLDFIHLKLLRILDLGSTKFKEFPPEILSLIWLRYLAFSCEQHSNVVNHFAIPPEICRLWNLQTFIIRGNHSPIIVCPKGIWETMRLRHLELRRFHLPNPPYPSVDGGRCLFSSNAQSISGLLPSCCTKEVTLRISNIKKLGIYGYEKDYVGCTMSKTFDNLVHLHQLETLSIQVESDYSNLYQVYIPSAKAFPAKLNKLKLVGTCLMWIQLNIIGELPNLEVLKLEYNACRGPIWNPIEGGFARLKHLAIDCIKLRYWRATGDNFPALEHLVIRNCFDLEEIPIEFSDINSLKIIELMNCNPKLMASAVRIQEEQEYIGNKAVDVRSSKGTVTVNNSPDNAWNVRVCCRPTIFSEPLSESYEIEEN